MKRLERQSRIKCTVGAVEDNDEDEKVDNEGEAKSEEDVNEQEKEGDLSPNYAKIVIKAEEEKAGSALDKPLVDLKALRSDNNA